MRRADSSRRVSDDSLYDLLPAIHRMRDAERGYPLRSLLRAIAGQAAGISADIARQYDDWFIETCADGLVPYFADLVALALGSPAGGSATAADAAIDAGWRRRQVADALSDRRRKGSYAVLDQLAFDATGWPVRVVELSGSTLATAAVRLADVGRRALVDTRDGTELEALDTPFATAAPLADVRRLSSRRSRGYANPANVAIWLWRLIAETTSRQPAASAGESNHYTFDPLGRDTQLCVAPAARRPGMPPAGQLDVPAPISRRAIKNRVEDYYGPGRSIRVYRGSQLVPRGRVLIGDLSGWRHSTPSDHITIDPVRGRLAFPARHDPEDGVWVAYTYVTVGGIGGGHYERPPVMQDSEPSRYRVARRGPGFLRELGSALAQWSKDKRAGKASAEAVIEICDDDVYAEHLRIRLAAAERLEIRAAPGCRPIIIPLEERTNRPDALRVRGEPGSGAPPELALDGIWIAGAPLELAGALAAVTLSHCTLVPATGTARLDSPHDRREVSLVVTAMPCPVSIASSVVGRIRVESAEVGHDPLPVCVRDSILDASDLHGDAIEGADQQRAFVSLSLAHSTVLGRARVREVGRITDSLLVSALHCERRQVGEVSFSYVPTDSHTPTRTGCQPDGVLDELEARIAHGEIGEDGERVRAAVLSRVAPVFDSTRFGDPAYGRLGDSSAPELTRGARDEGELGAYHDLWQRLRAQDLRRRLEEFAPAGTDIDILFAT